MAEADFSLMLEHFRRIPEELAHLRSGQATILQRLSATEAHLAAFHATEVAQNAAIAEINLRLVRIERRLDLREEV